MKLKLDENLPESLLGEMTALGQDVDNVRLQGLAGESDPNVWERHRAADVFSSLKISTSRISASSRRGPITV